MEEKRWLTLSEVMADLRVTRRTITRYVKDGKLRRYKIPVRGRSVFSAAEVEEMKRPRLEERRGGRGEK